MSKTENEEKKCIKQHLTEHILFNINMDYATCMKYMKAKATKKKHSTINN